ncbi:MAG: cytidylate kinase-like family protein [Sedimentisphaerales bacterium]|nr:cytidylate kinase-like family protein [Sedimentisphaerales bacterium]
MPGKLFQGQDIGRIVEQQMRQWELSKEKEHLRLSTGVEIDYITISRELGSGGEDVAEHLSKLMNWQFYDKDILDYMSENMNVHRSVIEAVDERTKGWMEDWLMPLFSSKEAAHVEQLSYYKHLTKVLLVLARMGRAIIVGRAAGQVLPRERGLSVRVTAPFELRCQRYAAERDISLEAAQKVVQAADATQRRFVKDFSGKDIDDPLEYDLAFSTELVTPPSVAKLIWRAFDQHIVDMKVEDERIKKSTAEIVAEQMHHWDDARSIAESEDRHTHLADGAAIDYISIERLVGSGGGEIALRLSKLMDWDIYDREILDYMSKNMNVHVKLLEGMDEQTRGRVAKAFEVLFKRKSQGKVSVQRYFEHLTETLLVIARHGKAIILGRGASKVLDRSRGLNVFVTAPFEQRSRHIAELDQTDVEAAAKRVKKADREQGKFVRDFTGFDINEIHCYDIVFNTGKFSPQAVIKLIWRAFDVRQEEQTQSPDISKITQ